jgi:hypothetical protein
MNAERGCGMREIWSILKYSFRERAQKILHPLRNSLQEFLSACIPNSTVPKRHQVYCDDGKFPSTVKNLIPAIGTERKENHAPRSVRNMQCKLFSDFDVNRYTKLCVLQQISLVFSPFRRQNLEI